MTTWMVRNHQDDILMKVWDHQWALNHILMAILMMGAGHPQQMVAVSIKFIILVFMIKVKFYHLSSICLSEYKRYALKRTCVPS
jgi:ABC-type dipeptide/oligopeptide/nickel transport system permease subunit